MADDLVVVYTAANPGQAVLIKSMLEAEGIPVMGVQEGAGAAYGLMVGPMGEVTLLVPAKYEAAARALVKAALDEGPAAEESGE
jgi:hypothetical protein